MMSSFFSDKKRENEVIAERSLSAKDFAGAAIAFARAAECSIAMADQSHGPIATCFHDDACDLLGLAEELKAKAQAHPSARKRVSTTDDLSDKPSRWGSENRPSVKFGDLKGLDEAKQIVFDAFIAPVKHPEVFKTLNITPGTGLLLYGPPRTGKTMFARAVANEIDATFMHVKLNEIKSRWVGGSEENVSSMFAEARKFSRCVLFLDEADALLRKRGNQRVSAVEQFLIESDGFSQPGNQPFILLATNRPWLLDSAVLSAGRISQYIHIGLPTAPVRQQIIEAGLKDVPVSDDVDIERIVDMTNGFAGGEIHHQKGGGL